MPTFGNVTLTTDQANLFQAALDRHVRMRRSETPQFDALYDVKPVNLNNPGDTITLLRETHLTPITSPTPLDEDADVTPRKLANPSPVSVTVNEYGESIMFSNAQRLFNVGDSGEPESEVARQLALSQSRTMESLAQAPLDANTNILREAGGTLAAGGVAARNTITASDTIKSRDISRIVARFRSSGDGREPVAPRIGANYVGLVHPDVAVDLRDETGETSWNYAMAHLDLGAIRAGATGIYKGVVFIEHGLTKVYEDAGAASADVYASYFLGAEALVKAEASPMEYVDAPQVDALRRFWGLGWKVTRGYAIYDSNAIINLETASGAV